MQTVRQVLQDKGFDVVSVTPEISVYDAIKTMAAHEIGAVLVMQHNALQGILSERDYARKIILQGRRSRDTQVAEIMTQKLITVDPEDSVNTCLELMTEHRTRHLPVLEDGLVIGLISIGDAVKSIIQQQAFMIEQLESYINGYS